MNEHLITTDHPLTPQQQHILAALQDTILPGSAEQNLPSAGGFDFVVPA